MAHHQAAILIAAEGFNLHPDERPGTLSIPETLGGAQTQFIRAPPRTRREIEIHNAEDSAVATHG